MAQLGADVDQLDEMSNKFKQASDEIRQLIGTLDSQVDCAWWLGLDADRFRDNWRGCFKGQLNGMIDALSETSTAVKNQAIAQRDVSRA